MSWLAEDLMTRRVVCVYADMDLRELNELFLGTGISGAPVTSRDGELLGVVSQRDLLRHELARDNGLIADSGFYEAPRIQAAPRRKGSTGSSASGRDESSAAAKERDGIVADIMTPVLFTVPESAPVEKVARLMRRRHIHRVIVLRDGRVVGLVSALDVIAVLSTSTAGTASATASPTARPASRRVKRK